MMDHKMGLIPFGFFAILGLVAIETSGVNLTPHGYAVMGAFAGLMAGMVYVFMVFGPKEVKKDVS